MTDPTAAPSQKEDSRVPVPKRETTVTRRASFIIVRGMVITAAEAADIRSRDPRDLE